MAVQPLTHASVVDARARIVVSPRPCIFFLVIVASSLSLSLCIFACALYSSYSHNGGRLRRLRTARRRRDPSRHLPWLLGALASVSGAADQRTRRARCGGLVDLMGKPIATPPRYQIHV